MSPTHLEPPEPPHRELSVEVPQPGQLARVAQVHVLVAAVEAAEAGQGGGLGRAHVVVDPHPPARVHPRHADRQLLYQLQVARSVAVSGFSVTALTLIIRIPRDIERVCDDPL